jgi:hypothetical protein
MVWASPFDPAFCPSTQSNNHPRGRVTDLRDTLAVLTTEENGPCDAAGVLALKEKGLGLSTLEAEDLAVATDEQLALKIEHQRLASSSNKKAAKSMCGGSAKTESDNCDGIEISKCECRIRDAVVPSHTNSSQSDDGNCKRTLPG